MEEIGANDEEYEEMGSQTPKLPSQEPTLSSSSTPLKERRSVAKLREILSEQRNQITLLKEENGAKEADMKKVEGDLPEVGNTHRDQVKILKREIEDLKKQLANCGHSEVVDTSFMTELGGEDN